jgi:hypothetical protein
MTYGQGSQEDYTAHIVSKERQFKPLQCILHVEILATDMIS